MAGMKRTVFAAILFFAHHGIARAGRVHREGLSVARPAVDRRRPARGRRVFFARRKADGIPERERTGQPVLSDLRARPHDGRHEADLSREGEDHLRLLPGPHRQCALRVDPPRSGVEKLQKAELEFRAAGKERRYAWDYDAEMELYLYRAILGSARASHRGARI